MKTNRRRTLHGYSALLAAFGLAVVLLMTLVTAAAAPRTLNCRNRLMARHIVRRVIPPPPRPIWRPATVRVAPATDNANRQPRCQVRHTRRGPFLRGQPLRNLVRLFVRRRC